MPANRHRIERRRDIPNDYVTADPSGNRASRRMAAKEAKARARGRNTSNGTGAAPLGPRLPRRAT